MSRIATLDRPGLSRRTDDEDVAESFAGLYAKLFPALLRLGVVRRRS